MQDYYCDADNHRSMDSLSLSFARFGYSVDLSERVILLVDILRRKEILQREREEGRRKEKRIKKDKKEENERIRKTRIKKD